MTLQDKIEAATTKIFTNTKFFGELIDFYPGGDAGKKQAGLKGVWDEGGLDGTNQVPGDGPVTSKPEGRLYRKTVFIEIASSVAIDETRRIPDMFVRQSTGEVVALKRIDSKDKDMMTLQCVRVAGKELKRNHDRG